MSKGFRVFQKQMAVPAWKQKMEEAQQKQEASRGRTGQQAAGMGEGRSRSRGTEGRESRAPRPGPASGSAAAQAYPSQNQRQPPSQRASEVTETQLQTMLIKLSLQNSQACREHSGILTSTYLLTLTSPPVQATVEKGQELAEMMKHLEKGSPSPIGPPHVRKFLSFLPKLIDQVKITGMGDNSCMIYSARTLVTHLEHLEMDSLQNLVKVFKVKEAYFDRQKSKGFPLMKLTLCLSEEEIVMGQEIEGEEIIPNFKKLVHELLMAQPDVSWKKGQAAASGLERGLQNVLESQGGSKRKQ